MSDWLSQIVHPRTQADYYVTLLLAAVAVAISGVGLWSALYFGILQ